MEANTRPLSIFDDEGICFPCRYAETFDQIDWVGRHQELLEIADWARENSNGVYDCVIGVSGGKDSHRQAFYARDVLGLKPLLVSCAYPPEQTTEIGAANISNLVEHGFDVHVVAPTPITSKNLMQRSFLDHGNIFIATELALYGSAPLVAIAHQIPLIFLGENPVLNFGGWAGSFDGDALRQRDQNTLAGAQVQPWVDKGFPREKLFWYAYPPEEDFERIGMRMYYLGYYMPDFNDVANTDFAVSKGCASRGRRCPNRGYRRDQSGGGADEDFVHVNQMLKMIKHGFGKVTQHAAVRVRMGPDGPRRRYRPCRRYDGACHERYIKRLCDYMGITVEKFWEIAEAYRNHDLWVKNNHGEWELRVKPH